MRYNWQQADWPEFTYDLPEVEDDLYTFATRVECYNYQGFTGFGR